MADADILLLPGLGGSGEDHWQTLWTQDALGDWPEGREWLLSMIE